MFGERRGRSQVQKALNIVTGRKNAAIEVVWAITKYLHPLLTVPFLEFGKVMFVNQACNPPSAFALIHSTMEIFAMCYISCKTDQTNACIISNLLTSSAT